MGDIDKGGRRIELVLYTSPSGFLSAKAVRNMERVLAEYERTWVLFTICDVTRHPRDAEADSITFTPTLLRRYPGPRAWILGDLEDISVVTRMLRAAGIERASELPSIVSA